MMDLRLSRRIAALAPSSTTAAGRKAKALAASGVDVVDLSIGEPDFATPDFVGRAGVRAIETGRTKYTDVAGEAALRDAIAAEVSPASRARKIARENVIVTAGAKQAVFNVCQALFDEGDDVALFSPYWVSFPEMVRLTGARPAFVADDDRGGLASDGRGARARRAEGRARRHRQLARTTRRAPSSTPAELVADRGLVRGARGVAHLRRDLRPVPLRRAARTRRRPRSARSGTSGSS